MSKVTTFAAGSALYGAPRPSALEATHRTMIHKRPIAGCPYCPQVDCLYCGRPTFAQPGVAACPDPAGHDEYHRGSEQTWREVSR